MGSKKGLPLIFKLHIVKVNHIAVLDAHFFQSGKQTAFAQLQVKVVPGFVIIKIDVHEQIMMNIDIITDILFDEFKIGEKK